MATWYAQKGSCNIDENSAGVSTVWNSAANGSGSYMDWTSAWAGLASGDILAANGKTGIRINVTIPTCARLSTAAESGTAGGTFLFTGYAFDDVTDCGTVTINANCQAGLTSCLTVSGGTLIIYGNISGSHTTANKYGIDLTGSGSLTIHGSVCHGFFINGAHGIKRQGTNTLVITVVSGDAVYTNTMATSCYGLYDASTGGSITINGNCSSGSASTYGMYVSGSTGVAIVINGNVAYQTAGGGIYFNGGSGSTLTVNGNVGGSPIGSVVGIQASGSGVITIRGDVLGGAYVVGLNSISTVSHYIYGNVRAGAGACGVSTGPVAASIKIQGNLIDSLGAAAYSGSVRVNPPADAYHLMRNWSDQSIKLPLQLPATDVKKGVVHGDEVGVLPPASPFRRLNRFV